MTDSSKSKPRFNSDGELMKRKNLWLTEKQWETLEVIGIEYGDSPSEVLERMLKEYLENHPEFKEATPFDYKSLWG